MAVTLRQRAHFEAIAEAMRREKDEQRLSARRSTAAERIEIGYRLGMVPTSRAIEEALHERALGQIGLAQRRPSRTR